MENIQNKPKMTPKDFFIHLSMLITLYVSAVALITFLFTLIDIIAPDRQDYYSNPSEGLAVSLSIFIVFYPILVILFSKSRKAIKENIEKADLLVRKWFLYLTIFITGLTVSIDLIVLISTFLNGSELNTAFILKIFAIVLVAGGIFLFALKDLKGVFINNDKLFKNVRTITTVVIVALVVIGIFFIGSPRELRQKNDDQRRINDLSLIQNEIVSYWQLKNALPAELSDLEDPLTYVNIPVDPETGDNYGYKIISDLTFEVCANFATESDENENALSVARKYEFGFNNSEENFEHIIGENCFERTIDPERFPKFDQNRIPTAIR